MARVPLRPVRSQRSSSGLLRGRTILIVEDEPLVALHLHSALREAGAGLIAATTAGEARRLISRNDISAAVIDVSLGVDDCHSVCAALSDRRIPFAFHTGHAAAEAIKRWPAAPVFIKPTPVEALIAGIAELSSPP